MLYQRMILSNVYNCLQWTRFCSGCPFPRNELIYPLFFTSVELKFSVPVHDRVFGNVSMRTGETNTRYDH